jgi:hypothetical protein
MADTENFVKAMLKSAKENEAAKARDSTDLDVDKIEKLTTNIREDLQKTRRRVQ